MEVVVAGSHGLIGSELVRTLRGRGDRVTRLVRRPAREPDEVRWNPDSGSLDPRVLAGADGVVNVAGAGVGDRFWTTGYKRTILESRTRTTGLLARTLARLDEPRPVWVQASAVGYYGDRGHEILTESSTPGSGFLARVVREWEAATGPAETAGVRVARVRSGIVMSPHGGAFGRLLPLTRLGLGGRLGPGTQYWSWITLRDEVDAVCHLLSTPVHGPVNLTAPAPATNAEITRELAHALGRRAALPVPSVVLRVVLGEFASEILGSQRAFPRTLQASGFRFTHPDLASACRWLAGRRS